MQIQVKQSVLESQRVKDQLFSCKNPNKLRETKAVRCENPLNKELLKEQNGFYLIPPVYSLRGIRAYDELQKLLQPKSSKSNRRLHLVVINSLF